MLLFIFIVLLLCATLTVSGLAESRQQKIYARHKNARLRSGLTGREAAEKILAREGIENVPIREYDGYDTNRYDTRRQQLLLSSEHYHGDSLKSVGIAAHEAAHALQHRDNAAAWRKRETAIRLVMTGNSLVLVLGVLCRIAFPISNRLMIAGISLGWLAILFLNLSTLPTEYHASKRAHKILLQLRLLPRIRDEDAMQEVLNAAALRYVGNFQRSLASLFYNALPLLGKKK